MASDMSLIVDGVDITKLSDEELYEQLTALGAVVGPIVGTTRKTYERKLVGLMGGSVSNYSFSDSLAPESDGETDAQPSQAYIERLTTGAPRARQRKSRSVLESSYRSDDRQEEDEEEEDVEEPARYESRHSAPLYSPSPRRPLHSPSAYPSYGGEESYLSSPLSSRLTSSAPVTSPSRGPQQHSPSPSKDAPAAAGPGQLVFKLVLVVILGVLLYFFFVAKSEKDSFASLGHMAKTAADAVEKSKAETRAGL